MVVLLEVILAVILLTVCAALVWPRPGRSGRVRDVRFPAGVKPSDDVWPHDPEGTLVRQLAIGEINRSQYLRAMSRLAERDAARHPLDVPGD